MVDVYTGLRCLYCEDGVIVARPADDPKLLVRLEATCDCYGLPTLVYDAEIAEALKDASLH